MSLVVSSSIETTSDNIVRMSEYRTWENFGVEKNWRIWRIEGHSPIFIRQCFFLGSVLAIHAAHSPIFYPPIDSDQRIRQCFTPPKFSHVRYIIYASSDDVMMWYQ